MIYWTGESSGSEIAYIDIADEGSKCKSTVFTNTIYRLPDGFWYVYLFHNDDETSPKSKTS